MKPPPGKRKPPRDAGRPSTDKIQVKQSHDQGQKASRIPAPWLREGDRLRAEAKRTGARRDILAWLRHEIGIVQRTTGGRP